MSAIRLAPQNVITFYNKRSTAEQWIREGKHAISWTRLSCHDFMDNQVRLQLFALAYNFGNFLRRLVLPREMKSWSLTTLREKLVKIGAKVVKHSRYVIFQMAEVFVTRLLFGKILDRIDRLRYLGFTQASNIPSVIQFVWRGGGKQCVLKLFGLNKIGNFRQQSSGISKNCGVF